MAGRDDWSTTADSNVTVGSVTVAEGSGPGLVNNAIREVMAALANQPAVTVASAATCDILGAASEKVTISGTTTITSFGTGINRIRFVTFSGALTLTHHATSLILPGAANIITTAGSTCIVVSDASSNARVFAYQPASAVNIYSLGSRQTFTATGTWTRPTGCKAVFVRLVGGGGGGGGADSDGPTFAGAGGGGAGGGYSEKWVTAPAGTVAVTIGAAGAGGAATGADGSAGGTTSFGAHCTATGGAGGAGETTGAATADTSGGGQGGLGADGDVNIRGQRGGFGISLGNNNDGRGGVGGGSMFGAGGDSGSGTDGTGGTATGYGGGGGGAHVHNDNEAPGGAGTAGICIVDEYY
jgi:hypothetical protein